MYPHRLLMALLLFAAGCGVSVGNPGDAGRKTFTLTGTVFNLEDIVPLPGAVRVAVSGSSAEVTAETTVSGEYRVASLTEGYYDVRVGENFSYRIPVSSNTRFDVFLPTPAAPSDFSAYAMEGGTLCMVWRDRSGLEAGYRLSGALSKELPASVVGLLIDVPAYPKGGYVIEAYNEYGASATAASTLRPAPAVWHGEPLMEGCYQQLGDDHERFLMRRAN